MAQLSDIDCYNLLSDAVSYAHDTVPDMKIEAVRLNEGIVIKAGYPVIDDANPVQVHVPWKLLGPDYDSATRALHAVVEGLHRQETPDRILEALGEK